MLRELISLFWPNEPTLEPLTVRQFESCVLRSQLPAIVFVTSNRGGICALAERELRLAMPRWAHKAVLFQVNSDTQPELLSLLDVRAVPSLLIFTSGVEVKALLGFHSADELHTQLWSIISTGEEP